MKVLLSHIQLCDPMDCNPPGSSSCGIFQARILEWVAISFSRGNLPDTGIEPRSPALQADFTVRTTREAPHINLELLYLHHELNTLSSCSDHVLHPYKMVLFRSIFYLTYFT